jgi:hypothetical protein
MFGAGVGVGVGVGGLLTKLLRIKITIEQHDLKLLLFRDIWGMYNKTFYGCNLQISVII